MKYALYTNACNLKRSEDRRPSITVLCNDSSACSDTVILQPYNYAIWLCTEPDDSRLHPHTSGSVYPDKTNEGTKLHAMELKSETNILLLLPTMVTTDDRHEGLACYHRLIWNEGQRSAW